MEWSTVVGQTTDGGEKWTVTFTDVDGTVEVMNFPWTADDFCLEYADLCIDDSTPDIVAICENQYALPPDTFEGTNFLSLCDVDYDYACEVAPELCIDGAFSTDLCGTYPEMCDSTSDDYNECAVDLYACLMDPDFDMCVEFPELCGLLSEIDTPFFNNPYEPYRSEETTTTGDLYKCKGEIEAQLSDVKLFIDTVNSLYDIDVYPGREETFTIDAGVRHYTVDSAGVMAGTSLMENVGVDVTARVPDLPELESFDNFDNIEDLFEQESVYFDIVGESGFMYSPYFESVE